ncbi:MAG: hypothetical protein GY940_07785 [bacterium]|nr:hypothetical protein [bacterium]
MERHKTNTGFNRLLPTLLIIVAIVLTLNLIAISYPLYVIIPMIKALFLVLVNFIYGFSVMSLFKKDRPADFVTAFAVGLMVTTLYFYLISIFKILNTPMLMFYYVLPLPLVLLIIRKGLVLPINRGIDTLQSLGVFFRRPKLEYLVFLLPLVYAALPSTFYDSLAYHLGIPNLYLQNGGFMATAQLAEANGFIFAELFSIPAVYAGDMVPRLFHLFTGVIFILFAVDFAADHFKITKRWILLLTMVSMPVSLFLLSTVGNDIPCGLFILLGISHFIKGNKKLSALFWGFAIGIKYTAIIPLGIFVPLHCIQYIKENERDLGAYLKQLAVFGVLTIAVPVPLIIKNIILTGNPAFPFIGLMTDNHMTGMEPGIINMMGPLFFIFLPFLLFTKNKKPMLLFFSLATLGAGIYFKPDIRVWIIAFIILSIYVTSAYEALKGIPRKLMAVLFFVAVGFNLFNGLGLNENLYRSHELLMGKAGIEEYKTVSFPTYKAISFFNRNAPYTARVLLLGEARGFYLKRPYVVSSGDDFSLLKKYLAVSSNPAQFRAAVKADGIDYIIYNDMEFKRLQRLYKGLTEEEFKRATGFLYRMEAVFREKEIGLFVLKIV